jgi:hypothetical protein
MLAVVYAGRRFWGHRRCRSRRRHRCSGCGLVGHRRRRRLHRAWPAANVPHMAFELLYKIIGPAPIDKWIFFGIHPVARKRRGSRLRFLHRRRRLSERRNGNERSSNECSAGNELGRKHKYLNTKIKGSLLTPSGDFADGFWVLKLGRGWAVEAGRKVRLAGHSNARKQYLRRSFDNILIGIKQKHRRAHAAFATPRARHFARTTLALGALHRPMPRAIAVHCVHRWHCFDRGRHAFRTHHHRRAFPHHLDRHRRRNRRAHHQRAHEHEDEGKEWFGDTHYCIGTQIEPIVQAEYSSKRCNSLQRGIERKLIFRAIPAAQIWLFLSRFGSEIGNSAPQVFSKINQK